MEKIEKSEKKYENKIDITKNLIKLYGFTKHEPLRPQISRLFGLNHNKKRVYTNYYGTLSCFNIDDKNKRFSIESPEKHRPLITSFVLGDDTDAHNSKSYLTWTKTFALALTIEKRLYVYDLFKRTAQSVLKDSSEIDAIGIKHDSSKAIIARGSTITVYTLPECKVVDTYQKDEEYMKDRRVKYILCIPSSDDFISIEQTIGSTFVATRWRSDHKQPETILFEINQLTIQPILNILDDGRQQLILFGKKLCKDGTVDKAVMIQHAAFTKEGYELPASLAYYENIDNFEPITAAVVKKEFLAVLYGLNKLRLYMPDSTNGLTNPSAVITYDLPHKDTFNQHARACMFFKDDFLLHIIYNHGYEEKVSIGTLYTERSS